jgi:hypothetical protein
MSRRSIVRRAPVASLTAAVGMVQLRYSRAFLYADRAHGRAAAASSLQVLDSVLDWTELWLRRVTLALRVMVATVAAALVAASLLAWAIATLH